MLEEGVRDHRHERMTVKALPACAATSVMPRPTRVPLPHLSDAKTVCSATIFISGICVLATAARARH
jgi:hypothetical protein